jgi:hypothetical protein
VWPKCGQTRDGPRRVYIDLNQHDSALATNPRDSRRILEFARMQWLVRPAEDASDMMRRTGNPAPYAKQAALFESIKLWT